jgi:type VI secretion system Hcp family effector
VKAVYVTIAGTKQGTLGNGKLKVLKYLFYAASPRVAATGAPGGKLATGPLSITKAWDAASVPLLQALETNEILPLVTVEFLGIDPRTGAERQLFTVRVKNASVASIKQIVDTTTSEAVEEVDFIYQSIEVQDDTTRATAATSPTAR